MLVDRTKRNRPKGMMDEQRKGVGVGLQDEDRCKEEERRRRRRVQPNEETVILEKCGGGGALSFDLSEPSMRVTGLSSEGGLR